MRFPSIKNLTLPGELTVTLKVMTTPLYTFPGTLGVEVVDASFKFVTTIANVLEAEFPAESVVVMVKL